MRRNLATWLSGIPVERAVLGLVLALGLWLGSASVAQARVQRFAIVIGNNQGLPGDGALRYAESDASRMNDVLLELGSFEPVNVVLLAGKSASTLRSTLITLNDRIRATVSLPNTQVMLFVYYSGHADAENLHMGESLFGIAELAELVRGSAASFRLLILDACRSGALTRVKGGRITAPFGMPEEPRAPEEGLAFLTASSADEDAQESDALRGSFFTHALISGLLGAADGDGDGSVALDEAYRYAYESTVRATSRTLAGAQHPTFHYDFRGYGALVLTRPALVSDRRGVLRLPANMDVLIMADHADGPVIAEVGARDPNRALSLRAGVYYLRARGDAELF
jgi:hypothetical protein